MFNRLFLEEIKVWQVPDACVRTFYQIHWKELWGGSVKPLSGSWAGADENVAVWV